MNEHDRSNLDFLMSLKTQAQWQDWADHCDADDFVYAMELLKTAQAELIVEEIEAREQDEELDLTEATAVLSKYRL